MQPLLTCHIFPHLLKLDPSPLLPPRPLRPPAPPIRIKSTHIRPRARLSPISQRLRSLRTTHTPSHLLTNALRAIAMRRHSRRRRQIELARRTVRADSTSWRRRDVGDGLLRRSADGAVVAGWVFAAVAAVGAGCGVAFEAGAEVAVASCSSLLASLSPASSTRSCESGVVLFVW